MNNHEIDFLKNKTYIGIFYLLDDKEVMGQLIYQKNSNFELKLFSDFLLDKEKETAIPFIYGKIHDEQYETYFISLKDCQLFINSLGSYGYQYQVFFDVALFSRHRTFDFLKEPFEEWFELKADEIYDSGENAANILNDYYKKNGVDFYKIYIEPIKNLSKIERDAFLKALSFHLADDYSPMPDKVKYVITQGMDPIPNALD